ncbi:hypothetical protein ACET3X_003489 [Alternaria dauci]|uniref:Uncharacterized protein n=1 Tax=Alternaria dauci TaxID=48095 RepID=A0ABR3UT34_9PLEO
MNVPTNRRRSALPHGSRQSPDTTTPPATGCITNSAQILPNWDTSRPILRFDFPNAETQSTFHRAFLQVRSEQDKAAFMARFFENYDGQVSIPRRVIMDTSRDEQVAREVQQGLEVAMDTERDMEVARRLEQQVNRNGFGEDRMNTQSFDEEMASLRRRRLDFERRRLGYGSAGAMGYNGGVDYMVDQFGVMSVHGRGAYPDYAPQRRRRRPNYDDNGYGAPYPPAYGRGDGPYGNGGYDNGYVPRYGNWGQRRGY